MVIYSKIKIGRHEINHTKLYTKAGFRYVQKREFLTKVLDHLQIKPEN
jgi:hypothetical protein